MNIGMIRKGLLMVNVILTVLLFWIVYRTVWESNDSGTTIHQRESRSQRGGPAGTNGLLAPKQLATYQEILRRDIFDTTPSDTAPVSVSVPEEEIEISQLNLKLLGTVVGDHYSYAVIADGRTRKEGIYTVDDPLQNAMISDIRHDRVILQVGEKKEALVLFSEGEADKSGENLRSQDFRQQRSVRRRPSPRRAPARPDPTVNRLPSR